MGRSIIPRDEIFYDKFEKIGALIMEGVTELKALVDAGAPYDVRARRIKTIEHESDEVVHTTMEYLHKTFVTPLDREDIHRLVGCMDDILDLSEAAASRIELYKPKEILSEAQDLAGVLLESAKQVKETIDLLRNLKKQSRRILELAVEINRLENDADQIRRMAIARLFREEKDIFELIKWKDIIEHMEGATDRCEDVSDIVEGIVLENT
jgi:hypothetical protein